MWVLDHQRDLDADFLACYGIDLETEPVSGPRYLALAHRVSAYGGVMSSRRDEQEEQAQGRPSTARTPAGTQADGEKHIDLVAFKVAFPGVISTAEG